MGNEQFDSVYWHEGSNSIEKVFARLILLLILTECQERTKVSQNNSQVYPQTYNQNDKSRDNVPDQGEKRMNQLIITIDDQDFGTKRIGGSICQIITIDELHGNEKYYYMNQKLPSQPQGIDLMLYGDDCLVLFYENFSTTYSYTRLGRVVGFVSKVGSGSINVIIHQ